MPRIATLHTALALLALSTLPACTGRIGDDPRAMRSDDTGAGGASAGIAGSSGAAGSPGDRVIATDPGRVTMHRLNRVEYDATVRDLLGTSLRPAEEFPPDDRGNGFDNIADILTLSPLQIGMYQAAAAKLVDELMASPARREPRRACSTA